MIDSIDRGWDPKGLVAYLMGRGRHNEHTRPTVIAAWDGDPGGLQPSRTGPGDFDYNPAEYKALLDHVDALSNAAGLPRRQPEKGSPGYTKHGYVWHCSIALPVDDGLLGFDKWRQVAEEVMHETGIAGRDDAGGCRWLAVHHGQSVEGNDHIHIAAVLVRSDTGKRFYPKDDWPKTRTVMRRWEDQLGLRATAINDGTAPAPAKRGEAEKATRRAAEGYDGLSRAAAGQPARVQLRQVVTETAAVSTGSEEFLAGLREQGVLVHLHRNSDKEVDGYAVADPTDVDKATGRPIFFSGRQLAPELSWPKLNAAWVRTNGLTDAAAVVQTMPRRPDDVLQEATQAARLAATAVRAGDAPQQIAQSLQGLLAAWARTAEGAEKRGPISQALWSFDRAARAPKESHAERAVSVAADALRRSSRDLALLGVLSGRGSQRAAGMELALAVAAVLMELAVWQRSNDRPHQAVAATRAANFLKQHHQDLSLLVMPSTIPNQRPSLTAPSAPTRPPVPRTSAVPNPTTTRRQNRGFP